MCCTVRARSAATSSASKPSISLPPLSSHGALQVVDWMLHARRTLDTCLYDMRNIIHFDDAALP
eukprot:14474-Amphidinium_carterae.1